MRNQHSVVSLALCTFAAACVAVAQPTSQPVLPEAGQTAVNFTLKTLEGRSTSLYELTNKQKVVLVTLRGWPGYQCPICTQQVGELIRNAKQFEEMNTHVLLVYPGPSDELQAHAKEFIQNSPLPANFTFVIDPDYVFVNLYRLRWEAEKETAYPSTFVVDRQNVLRYVKISKTHGDRAPVNEVLDAARNAK
jgi:peroxiredoxin